MSPLRPHQQNLNHRVTITEAVELGDKFERLLRLGDEKNEVWKWIEQWDDVAAATNVRGYAAWRSVPRHPFAAGLAAFRRWCSDGAKGAPAALQPFLEWSYLVESFRPDWESEREKFAAELRGKSLSVMFELVVAHQFRLAGHHVRYMFPQDAPDGSFDLLLGEESLIEVECKLVKAYDPIMEELAGQLFSLMHRTGHHRVIFVKSRGRTTTHDVGPLVLALKNLLFEALPVKFTTQDGRFDIKIEDGGSVSRPITSHRIDALRKCLDEMDDRLAEWQAPSSRILTPGYGVMRGIGLTMLQPPHYARKLVEAVCDASSQLTGSRPGIAAVGLSSPIPNDQEDLEGILTEIQSETIRRLAGRAKASGALPKVSGVHLFLPMETNAEPSGPAIGGGVARGGWTNGIHRAFRNPDSTHPLPEGFRLNLPPRRLP